VLASAEFIAVAEESGLIVALGEWALREGCRRAAQWHRGAKRERGARRLCLAINVSARQFQSKNFAGTVTRILAETGCDPQWLELEITEATITEQLAAVVEVMQSLRPMGVGLSINGFGSSYASLMYLKRLPIHKLKIDRSFIRNLDDPHDAAIVRATIQLARSLSLKTVAEGIETPAQLDFLRNAGCDLGQGYGLGHPLPLTEADSMDALPSRPRVSGYR
jgi:EAL domain-containing protein (putative c-di-GMP-specific phosphodiesterase class I)